MNSNDSRNGGISRRTAIASGLAALVAPRFAAGAVPQDASQKLRIACIGVGGVGQDYVAGCKDEEIVALCDLDHEFSAPALSSIRRRGCTRTSARCSTRKRRTLTR